MPTVRGARNGNTVGVCRCSDTIGALSRTPVRVCPGGKRTAGQEHCPLPEIIRGEESLGHLRSQVELLQLKEHEPVHVTWQVDPFVHETLPLLPTVTVQLEPSQLALPLSPAVRLHVLPPLHSVLQEPPQEPVHLLPSRHLNEQLPPDALQPVFVFPVQLQSTPTAQVHAEPLQTQPSPGHADEAGALDPQAKQLRTIKVRSSRTIMNPLLVFSFATTEANV